MLLFGWSLVRARAAEAVPIPKRVVGVHYPRFAKLTGLQGSVTLIAVIALDGSVESVRSKTLVNPLTDSAKASLMKWVFSACNAASGGCEVSITFTFVLDDPVCEVGVQCPEEFRVDLPDRVEIRTRPMHAIVN